MQGNTGPQNASEPLHVGFKEPYKLTCLQNYGCTQLGFLLFNLLTVWHQSFIANSVLLLFCTKINGGKWFTRDFGVSFNYSYICIYLKLSVLGT